MNFSQNLAWLCIASVVVSCSDKKDDTDSTIASSWYEDAEARLQSQIPVKKPLSIVGVSSKMDADYGGDVSNSDLVNLGSSSLSSVVFSQAPFHGPDSHNNGAVGAAGYLPDLTFWLDARAGDTYSITYTLDTNASTLGYDINTIQTIHGWSSNSGLQKNQNYVVEVSTVSSISFAKLVTVAFEPFTNAVTSGSSRVNISENTTGILATGVDQIRFTYTVQPNSTDQPGPTIREIDVFGVATH